MVFAKTFLIDSLQFLVSRSKGFQTSTLIQRILHRHRCSWRYVSFKKIIHMHAAKLLQLCLTLCDPTDCNSPCPLSLSVGFSRQEYWSGLACPPPGDLPDPVIKPASLMSPALVGRFSNTEPPGKSNHLYTLL